MRTLNRYLGREVLYATLLIFVALLALFAFFDLIHELGNVGKDEYTLGRAMLFVSLNMPGRLYELFPVAALIGTLFALSQLVANSEYTVMRASGMSLSQVTWALVRIGIPLAIATFLAGELVAPPAERLAQQVRVQSFGAGGRIAAQQFESGFWFKQEQTFVNVRNVMPDMTLNGVKIYEFDKNLRLTSLRVADAGRFVADGVWELANVKTTLFEGIGARVTRADGERWETVLRPSLLNVYQVPPERLELASLWDNISVLGHNQQKTSRFEIAFWNKVFYPVAVVVMMVLALPFSYFQRRSGGVGFRIFVGTIVGLVFFLVARLFSNLGIINDWPPLFSAAFPVFAFMVVTVALLWRLERR